MVAATLALVAASCSSGDGEEAGAATGTPSAAPSAEVEPAPAGLELEPGTRYRFSNVIQGGLDVEFTAPESTLYSDSAPSVGFLSPDADQLTDGLLILDVASMQVLRDPYVVPPFTAGPDEMAQFFTTPPRDPEGLLSYLSQLPYVEVAAPERDVTVDGVEGRAIDVGVLDVLPPQSAACAEVVGVPSCAGTIFMPVGFGFFVEPGQSVRFMTFELPAGPVLIQQNLEVPAAQEVLDSLAFVET